MDGSRYWASNPAPTSLMFDGITYTPQSYVVVVILLFVLISTYYMHSPTDRIAHTTAFVIPLVEHWLDTKLAQWVYCQKYN